MVILGKHVFNIDAKNRIAIPSKFRDAFGNKCVLSKGLDNCLMLNTPTGFQEYHTKMSNQLSENKKDSRFIMRQLFSNAVELDIDSAGRILIPSDLKQLAEIKKEVVIIGVGNRAELWSKERFDRYEEDSEKNGTLEDLMEKALD